MSHLSVSIANPEVAEAASILNTDPHFGRVLSIQNKILVKYSVLPYSIVAFYVLLTTWIIPAIMKNRKPYSLQRVLIVYNLLQAIVNSYIAYLIIDGIVKYWDARCMVKDNPKLPEILEVGQWPGYLLYLVKLFDLLDTVFFVLRKKQNQVSFLHVFHHGGMCLIFFWGLNSLPKVPGFYPAVGFGINTVVHVIMYTYYGLAAIGPEMQKYLWWKKHLTRLQIGQIAFILAYMIQGFLSGCEEFGKLEFYTTVYVAVNLILFLNFYRKYKKQ